MKSIDIFKHEHPIAMGQLHHECVELLGRLLHLKKYRFDSVGVLLIMY